MCQLFRFSRAGATNIKIFFITDQYIYVSLKTIVYDEKNETFRKDQLSIIFLKNLVITIQEFPGEIFNNIKNRILQDKGRIRKMEDLKS